MDNEQHFCRSCGTRLKGEKYCPKCQRPTTVAMQQPHPPVSPQPTPSAPQQQMSEPTTKEPEKGKWSDSQAYAAKAVICGIVILIAAGIVASVGDSIRIPIVVVGTGIVAAIWKS